MKSAGKARNNGLYRHIRTSKEIIRNLLNDSYNNYGFIIISLWKDTQRHRWTNRKSKRRNTDF